MAGFTLGNMTTYTSQISDIFVKSVMPETLYNTVDIMENVKYKTAINLLSKGLYLQNTVCGPSVSGDTELYQRVLEVCEITSFDKFCMTDLNQYWTNEKLSPGSNITDLDFFSNVYLEDLAGRIAVEVQKIFWRGDTDAGTGNLALCDGIHYILSGSTTVVKTGTTSITTPALAVSQINTMLLSIPAEIQGKPLYIYLSHTLYNYWIQGWNAAFPNQAASCCAGQNGYTHPFYANVTFAPQSGLEGTGSVYIGEKRNFVYGCDIKDEHSKVEVVYNPFDKYVYTTVNWKQGAQVRWPDQIVWNGI